MSKSTSREPVGPEPVSDERAEKKAAGLATSKPSRRSAGRELDVHKSSRSTRGGDARPRSYSAVRAPLWKRPWLIVWRRIKVSWDYWTPTRILSGGLHGGMSVVDSMFKISGGKSELERNDGRILVRTWPTRKTMCNPVWWVSNAGLFARRWLVTRRYLPLLLAAPAAMAALGLVGAISAGSAISAGTHSMLYKRILAVGIEQIDMHQAALAVTALIRINPDNTDAIFDRALIEAQAGNTESASHIMTELASTAKSPNAAMWLAQSVGDLNQFNSWSTQQKITYHHWVQIAKANAPDNPLPRRLVGQVRAQVGNKMGAYETLLPIADIDLETSLLVYGLQKELGLTELAQARSEKLERGYKLKLLENPLDLTVRSQFASLVASLDRFEEAKNLLNQGLAFASTAADRLQLDNALGELLVAEAAHLAVVDKSPAGLIQRMNRLKQAADAAPQNERVLEAITQVCFEAEESKNNELVILRESLIQNIDPDTSHFILGTIALNQGKIDEAKHHLELAAKNNSHMPGFLNNLAHAICYSESPDLERALRIANAANELQPNHPHLRETRGQIYLKLKRYTDAIADLEVALSAPELGPQVRNGLAEAYEAIGQVEIAKRQRELAGQ